MKNVWIVGGLCSLVGGVGMLIVSVWNNAPQFLPKALFSIGFAIFAFYQVRPVKEPESQPGERPEQSVERMKVVSHRHVRNTRPRPGRR